MNWYKLLPPSLRPKNAAPGKPLIDTEYLGETVETSPVPVVLTLTLIWMVSAVLLTLSDSRQRDLTVWVDGQKAPFSVRARCDFSYEDTRATEAKRDAARNGTLWVYRIDGERQKRISEALADFQSALQNREQAEAENRVYKPGASLGAKLVSTLIDAKPLFAAIKAHDAELRESLDLGHGIAGAKLALPPGKQEVRIAAADGKNYTRRPLRPNEIAVRAADTLQLTGGARQELIRSLETLLDGGTLVYDPAATEKARSEAAAAVTPVRKNKSRRALLVERNGDITKETVSMLKAERKALPHGFGVAEFNYKMGLSLLIVLAAALCLYRTYPKLFASSRQIALCGVVIILSLVANYGALQLFFYFFRSGVMPEYDLMLFMVPIPLGAALMSIMLGNRTALFSGLLVAVVSALMILPDRSFELALRWFAISALTTLFIRDVRNYRSFFVRVFFGSFLLTAVVNSDFLYRVRDVRLWKIAAIAAAANAMACAMADLLLVFIFELVFNIDTSMSLMVLCDNNHPLLEKLKREAHGTYYHSVNVATLAEDAANAIKANSLRAKAGALYHDIGKLEMPQYFIENNMDSAKEHDMLPPQRSSGIIRGHVKEGLALARKYRLCRFVRDAIATHHGDDLVSFFYNRALEQQKDGTVSNPAPVLESQFRYDGAPSVEKELTIISLADACEAACRSLNKPAPAQIEALVDKIFIGRLKGGQLRNSELTLEELDKVRDCFIADLISFNHGRIAYQPEKKDDPAAQPVAQSPAPGAPQK